MCVCVRACVCEHFVIVVGHSKAYFYKFQYFKRILACTCLSIAKFLGKSRYMLFSARVNASAIMLVHNINDAFSVELC